MKIFILLGIALFVMLLVQTIGGIIVPSIYPNEDLESVLEIMKSGRETWWALVLLWFTVGIEMIRQGFKKKEPS